MNEQELVEAFNAMPFADHLGVELTGARDGTAEGRMEFRSFHSSVPGGGVAHGGATYALADTVAGAAVTTLNRPPTPTIDMRIDYLAPATDTLHAEATVVRSGGHLATAEVGIDDAGGTHVADAVGVYKTDGAEDPGAWDPGAGRDSGSGD